MFPPQWCNLPQSCRCGDSAGFSSFFEKSLLSDCIHQGPLFLLLQIEGVEDEHYQ